MSEYVTLMGSEDVAKAGYAMRDAAQEMKQAASSIEDTFQRQRVFLEEWLRLFEQVPD